MPRAALLSIHARVAGARPDSWDDPSLIQVWGPRYQVYVIAERDLAVFTLSRLPDAGKIRDRADDLAPRLHELLGGERMRYGDAGHALGVHGNMLRYAALDGQAGDPLGGRAAACRLDRPAADDHADGSDRSSSRDVSCASSVPPGRRRSARGRGSVHERPFVHSTSSVAS